jgi:hypothetical protein
MMPRAIDERDSLTLCCSAAPPAAAIENGDALWPEHCDATLAKGAASSMGRCNTIYSNEINRRWCVCDQGLWDFRKNKELRHGVAGSTARA